MKSKFNKMFTEDFQIDGQIHVRRNPHTGVHEVYCSNKDTIDKLMWKLIPRDRDVLNLQHNSIHNVWGVKIATRHVFERIMKAAEVINGEL